MRLSRSFLTGLTAMTISGAATNAPMAAPPIEVRRNSLTRPLRSFALSPSSAVEGDTVGAGSMRLAVTLGIAALGMAGGEALAQEGPSVAPPPGQPVATESLYDLGHHSLRAALGPLPLSRGAGSNAAQTIGAGSGGVGSGSAVNDFWVAPPVAAKPPPVTCPKDSATIQLGNQWICPGSH
jgi:hypothetical protein